MWESRTLRLYGENACPAPQPNSSGWDLGQDCKLWNGRNGRSGKLSHSSDVIGACICSNDVNVRLHPLWVRGQWQCCYGSFLSIIVEKIKCVGVVLQYWTLCIGFSVECY